jgi:ParB-like chromosome segregation protein Spo0J
MIVILIQKDRIGNYRIHPAANLFPLMDLEGKDFERFVADIRANRLQQRIVRYVGPDEEHKGEIIEGRHRLIACLQTGIEPEPFDDRVIADPIGFVLSANEHRRHLTTKQRRHQIVEVLKDDPTKANRQIAAKLGVADKTVAAVRYDLEVNRVISAVASRVGADNRTRGVKPKPPKTTEANRGISAVEAADPGEFPQSLLEVKYPSLLGAPKVETSTAPPPPQNVSPRQTKFTPENIQKIRKLLEQGASREEIAERIGVTVASLQSTASRLGISLRRPVVPQPDIGPNSKGETKRKPNRLEELEAENYDLKRKVLSLTSEVGELTVENTELKAEVARLRIKCGEGETLNFH